jgi:AcrR family transcriptional regulator
MRAGNRIDKELHVGSSAPPVKRQRRGVMRMEQLLEAAEAVFAEVGYERATTIMIGERAGVSPGTLYQFFKNKQEFAEELASRYATRLREIKSNLTVDRVDAPLEELIDRVVDPFIAFHQTSQAFPALFLGSSVSEELREHTRPMQIAILDRLTMLFRRRDRERTESELRFIAEICAMLFRAFIPLISDPSPRHRAKTVRELKTVLVRYLQPYFGE